MAEHPNEARIRSFYEALSRRDVPAMMAMMASEVSTTVPGTGPLAGHYEGREAVFGALSRAMAESGGTFQLELRVVIANDDYAFTLHRWTAERGGRSIEANNINVYRFRADGSSPSGSSSLTTRRTTRSGRSSHSCLGR